MTNIQSENDFKKTLHNFVIYVLVGGGIGILLYASKSKPHEFLSLCGTAMMISGASFGGGALLGFLFGIPISFQPETLQNQQAAGSPGRNTPAPESQLKVISSARGYRGNTNLEDISNWLTKMLLGVGLTQIPAILKVIIDYSEFASPSLGGEPGGKVFATAILIYFLICGFVSGFLWARFNLAQIFDQADNYRLKFLEKEVSIQQKQIGGLLRRSIGDLFTTAMLGKEAALCELKPYGDDWITLVTAENKIVAMYRYYDSGVVLAMGYDHILSPPDPHIDHALAAKVLLRTQEIITAIFDEILSKTISDEILSKKTVFVSSGHGEVITIKDESSPYKLDHIAETLESSRYTIEDIKKPIDTKLSKENILIVGNAWGNFEDKEIEAVRNFVSEGGSLFVVGQTWSWAIYNFEPKGFNQEYKKDDSIINGQDQNKISTYPMNKLVKPYGMFFTQNVVKPNE